MHFESIGLKTPEILFPKKGSDLKKWAVVACDQYTSQPEYWNAIDKEIGQDPSTLRITFPELYLEKENEAEQTERINTINKTMQEYLDQRILVNLGECFILLDRKTPYQPSRKGLIVALDLEHYDYNKGSTTLIRATEGTIVDRLPPRVKVRKNAPIELPHIMVLIDDPGKTVIEPLFDKQLEKIADFDLLENSGHITSHKISDTEIIQEIASKIEALADQKSFEHKYGVTGQGPLLYAMGDGNHSLATAKAIWEDLKSQSSNSNEVMNHPARFALVELVNVHDDGLEFEPIHRVIFNVNTDEMFDQMKAHYEAEGSDFDYTACKSLDEAKSIKANLCTDGSHGIVYIRGAEYGALTIKSPKLNLEVGTLQLFLDGFLKEHLASTIDYIHGEDVVTDLGSNPGNIGFYLDGMNKHDLFKTVILDGALPRKTFSMGEACEKRFYLECRKIR